MIFVSSDQVFDGRRGGYREDDPVGPARTYGRQKAAVERHLATSAGRWCVVRTGWNVAWRVGDHCPVVNTYRTLLRPGARMATDNVLTITDLCDTTRILLTLARTDAQGIFHVAAAPPITRVELAELTFQEPRPKTAWLANNKVVRELGARFATPYDVVPRKTRLVDAWMDRGEVL